MRPVSQDIGRATDRHTLWEAAPSGSAGSRWGKGAGDVMLGRTLNDSAPAEDECKKFTSSWGALGLICSQRAKRAKPYCGAEREPDPSPVSIRISFSGGFGVAIFLFLWTSKEPLLFHPGSQLTTLFHIPVVIIMPNYDATCSISAPVSSMAAPVHYRLDGAAGG
ncbi:hypothetical protein HYFRA_00013029 [Hymenoscyphus fraxineus]|uniref:Uncharacterized protein n=1 Tax=Hymenoscyphus fraxineus TaxID=746836 RepID=A0A9N9PXC2_9HELO|nr:hypothetical protein HYFRA_00013029 [Hymenoscyphus fraxineus]